MAATIDTHLPGPQPYKRTLMRGRFALFSILLPAAFVFKLTRDVYPHALETAHAIAGTVKTAWPLWHTYEEDFRRSDASGALMPAIAQEIVDMARKNGVDAYVLSAGLLEKANWACVRVVPAALPSRRALTGQLTFQLPEEAIKPGCRILETGQEVHLVACP